MSGIDSQEGGGGPESVVESSSKNLNFMEHGRLEFILQVSSLIFYFYFYILYTSFYKDDIIDQTLNMFISIENAERI